VGENAGALVPAVSELSAPTRVEQLTAQFYGWEVRGRGWWLWPYAADLEPPFVPFVLHDVPLAQRPTDDARKPTVLSELWDFIRGRAAAPAPPVAAAPSVLDPDLLDVAAEPYTPEGALLEFQVSVPPTLKVTKEACEQFLLALSYCACPVSFEVIGTRDAIRIQLACREEDAPQLQQQLAAHFPDAVVTDAPAALDILWTREATREAVVVDFGLSEEFMRPLRTARSFEPDPLIAIAAALADLGEGELGVLQVLFQRTRYPWAESVMRAVTDWEGHAFFVDAPEMAALAKTKIARPLFAALVRVAAQSPHYGRAWTIAKALGAGLAQFADPPSNELIPLSDDQYPAAEHETDLVLRQARRSGMLLNSEELVSLVHVPSASLRVPKVAREMKKTKAAPSTAAGRDLVLGENLHAGRTTPVTLGTEERMQHTHVIGASGTGKSTLLLNMIVQDLRQGAGLAVLDPHGDLIDHILGHVPDDRLDDVILLDPADEEYPVGFNMLSAHSALEKNLLSSDLVAVFRRLSTSWGDQMTSVLGNAVLAFLESEEGGTLADLRRFLIEPEYRKLFLATVRDPEVVYYWQREFPLLAGKPQAPLLTRLDAFLRPKPIRYMVAQRESRLDFGAIMNDGKIFLAKLAQGLIGEENAYLLGSLLVSKFHQLAMSRQELVQAARRPFYLYIDEFQNFVTPSMAAILSGARKYRLGLVLAHQDLRQVSKDQDVLSAVLSNPYTRVCFRVGDLDARRLEDGFASFDAKDLQSLGLGEAICRVERADYDFNLKTLSLPSTDLAVAETRRERIIARSREKYATHRQEVEALLTTKRAASPAEVKRPDRREHATPRQPQTPVPWAGPTRPPGTIHIPEAATAPVGRGGQQHQYLQQLIRRWAESKGWRAVIEQQILDGLGRVDVALEKGACRLACEISVTTSPEHEVGNVQKCLAAEFSHVVVVSADRKTLRQVSHSLDVALGEEERARVRSLTPEETFAFLEKLDALAASKEETVRGYRVKVQYKPVGEDEKETRRQAISQVILKALRRLRPHVTDKGSGEE